MQYQRLAASATSDLQALTLQQGPRKSTLGKIIHCAPCALLSSACPALAWKSVGFFQHPCPLLVPVLRARSIPCGAADVVGL